MLQIGDNVVGGKAVRLEVDEGTGKTSVYIPAVTSPLDEPVAVFDPAVTLAVITAFVNTLLGV